MCTPPASTAPSAPLDPRTCPPFAQIALADLLLEGKYAELMSKMPHTGSDVVTWVWWCVMAGGLLGSVCVGPLADKGMIKAVYAMSVPLAGQVMPVRMVCAWFGGLRNHALLLMDARGADRKPVIARLERLLSASIGMEAWWLSMLELVVLAEYVKETKLTPPNLQIILPVVFGFLPEKRLPKGKRGLQRDKIMYVWPKIACSRSLPHCSLLLLLLPES